MQSKSFIAACIAASAMGRNLAQIRSHEEEYRFPEGQQQTLAQTFAQNDNLTCTTSQDRNKAPLDDFYSIYEGVTPYKDDDFTNDSTSLSWESLGESAFSDTI